MKIIKMILAVKLVSFYFTEQTIKIKYKYKGGI